MCGGKELTKTQLLLGFVIDDYGNKASYLSAEHLRQRLIQCGERGACDWREKIGNRMSSDLIIEATHRAISRAVLVVSQKEDINIPQEYSTLSLLSSLTDIKISIN